MDHPTLKKKKLHFSIANSLSALLTQNVLIIPFIIIILHILLHISTSGCR